MRALLLLALLAIPTAAALVGPQTVEIRIVATPLFAPSQLVLRVGDSVFFTNDDVAGVSHVVTGRDISTPLLRPGDSSATFTLTEAAYYSYHCPLHGLMNGAIQVV